MEKIDFKKELKHLYKPSTKECAIVDVPAMQFLMVNGEGDPNTAESYTEAIGVLYAVAYTLKFMIKLGPQEVNFTVMPLEGLWWVEDMTLFSEQDKDAWLWTAMIMQPEYVTEDLFEEARQQVEEKKGIPGLDRLRLAEYDEGTSAQIMYIGPYADEAPTIQMLHAFIGEQGGTLEGKHHEIYLGDPRRTAPEKLKTVIRQPFV
ncbi:GyrI-like domain-containing protein [Gemmatimonadota bacterium]